MLLPTELLKDMVIGLNTDEEAAKEELDQLGGDGDEVRESGKESEREEALFDPPLYKQRYSAVVDVINEHSAQSVIDMGCSESQFILKLKDMCPHVEQIIGVDIDLPLLQTTVHRLKPLTIEYVLKRDCPLTMQLYHGSIDDPDPRLCGADVLACIEVIEHLYPDTLANVPHSLFGILTPRVVVITTPNCEYNVLFKNFSGMRHWDHKFEWSRREFESWCEKIVEMYPYDLKIGGVGEPPPGSDVGYCSQMAIFTHRQPDSITSLNVENSTASSQSSLPKCGDTDEAETETGSRKYDLVTEIIYPCIDKSKNRSERVMNETDYLINTFFSDYRDESEDSFTREVPVEEILCYPGLKKFGLSEEKFAEIIEKKYELSSDRKIILLTLQLSDFMRDSFSDDGSEFGEDNYLPSDLVVSCDEEESWD